MGNPLGRYPESVTIGVVSGLARTASAGPGRPHYDLLQTDCDIHEGNSGGPLVDVQGRVIGITTLLDTESPYIGLAIPAAEKWFASAYALFAGMALLVIVGVMFAPVFHRFLHHFHLVEDDRDGKP